MITVKGDSSALSVYNITVTFENDNRHGYECLRIKNISYGLKYKFKYTVVVMMSKESRINIWDNLKFLMIVLVVIGHFADEFTLRSNTCRALFLFIYSFHMQMLLFICGFFYNREKTKNNILFYISAGYIIKIFFVIVKIIIGVEPEFSLFADAGIPWFMFVLAIYYAVMFGLKDVNRKYVMISSIILACFAGYDRSVGDFLYISRSVVFFPFFFAGVIAKDINVIEIKKKYRKYGIIGSAAIVLIWGGLCLFKTDQMYFLRFLFTGRNPFFDDVRPIGPLCRLLSYAISAAMCVSLIFLIPDRKLPAITSMGRNTLNVYFWHYYVMLLLIRFADIKSLYVNVPGKILYFAIAFFAAIILSTKPFGFPLKNVKNFIDK